MVPFPMPKSLDFSQFWDYNFPIHMPKKKTTDIDRSFSLKHWSSYFPVLNWKYRSLQCMWSLAYARLFLISHNSKYYQREINASCLGLTFFFFTYQFDSTCTLIKNPNWFDLDAIFPIEWVRVPVPMVRKKLLIRYKALIFSNMITERWISWARDFVASKHYGSLEKN